MVHTLTDYLGAYEHFVFGPDSQVVSFGLYYSHPYVAVSLELAFIVATMFWVFRRDVAQGVRRSAATWRVWAAVFGGGTLFMFVSAGHSIAQLMGVEPSPAMAGTTVPMLAVIYTTMILALVWAESRPKREASPQPS